MNSHEKDAAEKPAGYGAGLVELAREHLVGRGRELGALWAGLKRAAEQPQIMTITGPPGIGKSATTSVFRLEAEQAGHRTLWFDGERNNANRIQFEIFLQKAAIPLARLGHAPKPDLLVIDALEQIETIAPWLLTDALLNAGPRLLTVFTSRTRLPLSLRAHVTVAPILQEVFLAPLSASDSDVLLSRLGLPLEHRATMLSLCDGLPLALILAAESKLDSCHADRSTAEVIQEFAEAVLRNSNETRKEALFALSMVRTLDLNLLQAMVEDATPALFDSLRGLPFVHDQEAGLTPHALVRDIFFEFLLRHHPLLHARMAERSIRALFANVTAANQTDYRRRIFDAAYTCRHDPQVRFLGAQEVSETVVVPLPDHRVLEVAEAIAVFEGEAGRRSFLTLHSGGYLETFIVCDANNDSLRGVLASAEANELPESAMADDPLLAAAVPRARALPQATEGVRINRWFFQPERYQSQEGAAVIMFAGPPISLSRSYQPAWSVFISSPLDAWASLAPIYRMEQQGGAVAFQGRQYGVFAKDLSSDLPPDVLLRAFSIDSMLIMAGLATVGDRLATSGISIDEIKDALRSVRDPNKLAITALARRFVDLRQTFDSALVALDEQEPSGPSGPSAILRATYWDAPVKQRATAADLGMAYGTYRRRLRQAHECFRQQLENAEPGSRD